MCKNIRIHFNIYAFEKIKGSSLNLESDFQIAETWSFFSVFSYFLVDARMIVDACLPS